MLGSIAIILTAVLGQSDSHSLKVATLTVPSSGLFTIASQQGHFIREDVSVEINPFRMGRDGLRALLNGDVDMATAYDTPILAQLRKGAPLKIIASIHSSRGDASLIVSKRINRIQDLTGKRIGFTFGTSAAYFFDLFLKRHGLHKKNVHLVNLLSDETEVALQSGGIDAAVARYPNLDRLKEKGYKTFDLDIFQANVLLVTTAEIAKKKPKEIAQVLKGLRRAESYFYDDESRGWKQLCEAVAHFDVQDDNACMLIPKKYVFRLRVDLSNVTLNSLESQNALTDYGPSSFAQFDVKQAIDSTFLKKVCGECVLF